MTDLIDEINRLNNEIDELWKIILESKSSDDNSDISSGNATRSRFHASIETKLGLSATRALKSGWRSAVRPWIDTPRIRTGILKSLGISSQSFMGGFISGIYGFAVSAILDGIAKLFRKKRSPLLSAMEPEEVYQISDDEYFPASSRSLKSEFYRGRGSRLTSREDSFRTEPLSRQIQRGVVGL